jgi:spermidine/putrescine transport system permease protein
MSKRQKGVLAFLLSPGAFWLVFFFLIPSALIIVYSFLTRQTGGGVIQQFDLAAWQKLLTPTDVGLINEYFTIFFRSLWWALITTAVCLLIGYPLAFFIVLQPERHRYFYLFLILIPFWTNFLVRTYALKFLLNNNGLINTLLLSLGMERIAIINTPTAVVIGLVYGNLPFMVLPLYASIEKLDFTLLEAAQDLYAGYAQAFLRVILPMTVPGIIAGAILVFVPVTGQYVVPTILGGGKVAMLGSVLEQQFKSAGDWPFGSAIAVLFMVTVMLGVLYHLYGEARREARELE